MVIHVEILVQDIQVDIMEEVVETLVALAAEAVLTSRNRKNDEYRKTMHLIRVK